MGFWEDHERDMADPDYRHHFVLESQRVAVIDAVVNELRDQLAKQNFSKAALARAVQRDPAAIRRVLTAQSVNPTLGLVAEMAAVLGYTVALVPMTPEERRAVSEPLQAAAALPTPKAGAAKSVAA